MHFSGSLLFLSLAAVVLAISFNDTATIIPGKYIVEFEGSQGSVLPSDFYTNLTSTGLNASHGLELSHSLLSGLSFGLQDYDDLEAAVEKIASMSIVKNIWPVRLYSWPVMRHASASNLDEAVHTALQARQERTSDAYAPHVMGGVDKLHAEGITGKGIFIAIVDSGVDYNHPALGGGFGPGFKFAHGYDLVGDNFTGENTAIPDPDPYTNCHPHGTHISGVVGANPNPWNFTGVAPDATLGMYRVGGCRGGPSTDVIIAAFLKAQADGADVITASIGSASGWTQDVLGVAIARIVANGTPCSIAAGNSGSTGAFYASGPAHAIDVLAVGSVDSTTSPALNVSLGSFVTTGDSNTSNTSGEFFYSVGAPANFSKGSFPIWTPVLNDPCAPFPEGTPNLSDKIVLMLASVCSFEKLATNAAVFGAKYIFFYKNLAEVQGSYAPAAPVDAIAMISYEQATSWIMLLKAGSEVKVNITGASGFFTYENEITGGYMSEFSSWSPTFDLYMKPQVAAPGANIISTFPLSTGGYDVRSGTSISTPYIAGVIALMKQVRGKSIDPRTINSLIGNSARPRYFNDGGPTQFPFLAPTFQQGGGLVNAYAAVRMSTILSESSILLNDTVHIKAGARFTIKNTGDQPATYGLAHQPAGTAYALKLGSQKPTFESLEFVSSYASVEITPEAVTLQAGASAEIDVKFAPPAGLDAARLPLYSGFIAINGTNGDILTLPYGGVAADMKTFDIIHTQSRAPFVMSTTDMVVNASPPGRVFRLPKSNDSILTNNPAYPQLALILAMGSAYITADLVPITENFICNFETAKTSVALLTGYPQYYLARDNYGFGQYKGTGKEEPSVPTGNYTVLVRALRIFGDKSVDEDYDVACANPFVIEYA